MRINKILLQILFIVTGLAVLSACQSSASQNGGTTAAGGAANTPTEAFKSLHAAVKSKNTDNIKSNMSKATVEFASGVAQMQKKTPEEMFKNGLTETAMSENLPPIRNERVKENMGAIEVRNAKGTWEDLPFVLEDGRWKLAVGDLFNGSYSKPAPSQAETEANNNVPQILPGAPDANVNNPNANPNSPKGKDPALMQPGGKQPPANKP
jgi:hypothetical protein